jgi:transmembrane sensor
MTDEYPDPSASAYEPHSELIDRYLAGECTASERTVVENWRTSRSARESAILTLPSAVGAMRHTLLDEPSPNAPDVARRADTILLRLEPVRSAEISRTRSRTAHRSVPRWSHRLIYGVGAAIAAMAITVVVLRSPVARTAPTRGQEYTTNRAQQANLQLPDGSRVLLAPGSRMRYTTDARGTRTVDLVGHAFFTVTHDAARTFIVRTGNVETRVLGTAFAVRRYALDEVAQIAVVEGRVMSHGVRGSVVLGPGMVGDVNDSSARVISNDARTATSWTQGTLVFEDTPVPVLLAALGRWYGYEFRLNDPVLASRHVTTVLAIDKPAEALNALRDLLGVDVTSNGSVVTLSRRIRGKRAPSSSAPIQAPTHRAGAELFINTEVGK